MSTDKSYKEHLASPAFMVICDGECDQICGTMDEAKRELKDLKAMGFAKVSIKAFDTWQEAHEHEDWLRDRV